jgi:signal transduction histidine kinase
MKTANASVGALGIVNLGDRTLEIVALIGYTPDEYPEGAQGLSWPLDKGIVARVMRTGNADIVSDVKIDPAYNGRLTGSLSQITVPMLSGRDVNAILILEKRELPRFSLSDWAFAQRISEHASIAIANAQLYSALTTANESKSEFMGFAAHELKTPLTSIRGNAEMLKSGMTGQLSDMQNTLVRIVHTNSIRMTRIINDLRDAAQMDARQFTLGILEPVDLRHMIDETAEPLERLFEDKNLTFVNEVPADLLPALGDKDRLVQVFTNLMTNSIKYTDHDKTVRAVGAIVNEHTDRNGKRVGRMVRISLVDQGYGMKPEDVARLGRESYFRSTNEEAKKKEGTGLGMKLTFGIVANHNGLVEIESELGKGTTFHIYLPLVEEVENAAESAIKPGAD